MSENVLLRRRQAPARDLAEYEASGGLAGLRWAHVNGREAVIRLVNESRLVGRGGAAFPTGRKWDAVRQAKDTVRYVVLNADESEPGTFKDRVLMETDPYMVLEGLLIASFVISATKAYVYVRGEYADAANLMTEAVRELAEGGHLDGIRPDGGPVEVEIRRGGGAYVCGEETALFRSLEGFRGEPQPKPPFPTVAGLFGKPTVINNVETLANVPDIVARGASWPGGLGTPESPGTKLFSVSGHVARPDVYEVPFGTPLSQLLEDAGAGHDVKAVLMGGAAGTFVFPEDFHLELSYEGARAKGATLGSGSVMVFDTSTNLWQVAERVAAFFAHESCGQCLPCRVGTKRQHEMLARLAEGTDRGEERRLLRQLGQVMADASICGLGQAAPSAVLSLIAAEEKGLVPA